MQKQGSKYRSTIFTKSLPNLSLFSTFFQIQEQTLSNCFHCLFIALYICTLNCCIICFCCLLACLLVDLSVFVCLFVCLCGYVIITSVSSIFVSMDLHLFIFLLVDILYYNFTKNLYLLYFTINL